MDEDADTRAGLTLALGGGLLLCEVAWTDPPPPDLQPLLAEAAAAILGADARSE